MSEQLEQTENVSLPESKPIVDAEWCFQFFDNEPIVFAFSNESEKATPLNLQIKSEENEGLIFRQNGMSFRIFPRPISEETKLEREKTKENDIR